MIVGVAFLRQQHDPQQQQQDNQEEAAARLQRGGLFAAVCTSQQDAAAATQAWGCSPGSVLLVGGEAPGFKLWRDVAQQDDDAAALPSGDRLMQAIVQHNRRLALDQAATANTTEQQQQQQSGLPAPPLLVVGYVMKASREQQLAAARLLPLLPADGLAFMPLDPGRLQQHQGHVDILLHKASDELVPAPGGGAAWSPRLLGLQAWLMQHPGVTVVDPFEATAKVLDRLVLSRLLEQLPQLPLPAGVAARAPRCLTLPAAADAPALAAALEQSELAAPFIVKPLVACGLSHSHSMALVLADAALPLAAAQLPRPAVAQEFVNHGGSQFKVYVLADQVFVTPRASIPDVHVDPSLPLEQQLLFFDSLASLPMQLPAHMTRQQQQQHPPAGSDPQQQPQMPNMAALEAIAAFLQLQLGLTLFGFDVVVASQPLGTTATAAEAGAGAGAVQELVVIDVNYFPNYRGGSNTPALFRRALRQQWQLNLSLGQS